VFGIAGGIAGGIAFGLVFGIMFGIAFGVIGTVGVGGGVAGGITVGVAGGLAVGLVFGLASGIAFGIASTRAYYLVAHLFYVWPNLRGVAYPRHPVAWDDCCGLPFPGLCRLLADYARDDKQAAEAEIDRLIDTYPTQRHEALKARTLLVAEDSRTAPLSRLDLALQSLPEGEKGFLRAVPGLKVQVAAIAQAQRRLDAVHVPAFREPLAAGLLREIRDFHGRVGGLRYPLNTAFREAALAWIAVAERQLRPAAQVFRAGDSVERSQEAFLPRWPIIQELQGQITLATGCPGLLLYGRRRMGKSTLLKNLQPFLPTRIAVASLSMQDPRVFASLGQWVGSVAGCTAEAAGMAAPVCGDLGGLFTWLGTLDAALASDGRRMLLALDEYENLDRKLGEEVFARDLLDTIRESIQRHRWITWLFAGSHALSELAHAEWSSWFVSLRTVELLPFSEAETRLLLTEPMRHSELWQDDEANRPRFDGAFWGEGGIERIYHETAGWPHLVQLLAERAVYLVNLRGLRACTLEILDETIAAAIASGDAVLRQLVYSESRLAGEWEYLKGFRTHAFQEPPADEAVYQSLRLRLMVTEEDGRWRMRVPLMRRWLRERG